MLEVRRNFKKIASAFTHARRRCARALVWLTAFLLLGVPGSLLSATVATVQTDSLTQLSARQSQFGTINGKIHFKRSSTEIQSEYLDNETQLGTVGEIIGMYPGLKVVEVNVTGSSSPEGQYSYNAWLSKQRAASLKDYLTGRYPEIFTDSLKWNVNCEHEDWSLVETLLKQSGNGYCEDALAVIGGIPYSQQDSGELASSARKQQLQQLAGGSVWSEMGNTLFPYCRGAEFQILYEIPAAGGQQGAAIPQVSHISSIESGTLPQLPDGLQYRLITSKIDFKRSGTEIVPSYFDNAAQLGIIREMADSFQHMRVIGVNVTGSASPEGRYENNVRLATARAARLKEYMVRQYPGIFTTAQKWDVSCLNEDWSYVGELLQQSDVEHGEEALEMISAALCTGMDSTGNQSLVLKQQVQQLYGGSVWKEMDEKIFPYTRTARLQILAVVPVIDFQLGPEDIRLPEPAVSVRSGQISQPGTAVAKQHPVEAAPVENAPAFAWDRQPMLAVKTNLLYYGAYIPNYGFAPIPNLALEYLPRHGKWTVGASLDMPWYRNYSNHKFMQIRNWQLEGRRYFGGHDAQYWGWYAQAYVHTGVFGIGFNKQQGWEGESGGLGIGGGYVLPISKDRHWKLEFNLQAGYMRSQYDPYVYGHPTNGEEDGLYYYKWKYDPDLFKERQYRHTWIGPTGIGVTLSYDLLYHDTKHKIKTGK